MIRVPRETDDKYSHGVLGVVTGSEAYPGAAVLGVDAALRTGVGMVRYLGPARPRELVLARRPEVVTVPGRVQAWLVGSGMPESELQGELQGAGMVGVGTDNAQESASVIARALASGVPVVLDAGALSRVSEATGPVVITPHRGELARFLCTEVAEIDADPVGCATRAAENTGAIVVLKGHLTHIVGGGQVLSVTAPTTWLATAGSGDALAGILGALVATHAAQITLAPASLAQLAATAVVIHGRAAECASGGGPLTILDLNVAIGPVIAALVRGYPET